MLTKRWHKINQSILKRQVPHAVLSWRYFMPGQSTSVKLHRNVFFNAWPALPRPAWILIALYSYTLWYFVYSWRHIYLAWKNNSLALFQAEGVARSRQLYCLFLLAISHAIPPRFYYQYRLYSYPRREWLNFVYTHELPHWHTLMSPYASQYSKQLLSDKYVFAKRMDNRGLPCVDTLFCLGNGHQVDKKKLFVQQSVFLKPRTGSRKVGCFSVHYCSQNKEYTLAAENENPVEEKQKIIDYIYACAQKCDYLVQPLLSNHEWLSVRFPGLALITIRVVTVAELHKPKCICATLEIPLKDNLNHIYPVTIDCGSGKLLETPWPLGVGDNFDVKQRIERQLINKILPKWEEIKSIAEQAHLVCLDISSVGWDLALKNKGVKLLEGNFNWGVYAHQRLNNQLIQNFMKIG